MRDRQCKNCYWSAGANYVCVLQGGGQICQESNYSSWSSKYKCNYHYNNNCSYTVENNGCLGETSCSYCAEHNNSPVGNNVKRESLVEKTRRECRQSKEVKRLKGIFS